jgi:hypothetical protein
MIKLKPILSATFVCLLATPIAFAEQPIDEEPIDCEETVEILGLTTDDTKGTSCEPGACDSSVSHSADVPVNDPKGNPLPAIRSGVEIPKGNILNPFFHNRYEKSREKASEACGNILATIHEANNPDEPLCNGCPDGLVGCEVENAGNGGPVENPSPGTPYEGKQWHCKPPEQGGPFKLKYSCSDCSTKAGR